MKLLIAGDFAAHTGLSVVNEALAGGLSRRGWDIAVLAINFHGDPTPLAQRYRLYPAFGGGDQWGVGRIGQIVQKEQPDCVLMVHDAWIVSAWLHALDDALEQPLPPCVGYIPVDGVGLNVAHVSPLNDLRAAIAYTQFGRNELRRAGLAAPCHVLPHGIDRERFYPLGQADARAQLGMDPDTYAVLVFDANQPRKRLDIAFAAFARFALGKPDHVKLVYHGPTLTKNGWDVEAMAADLGIHDRLQLSSRYITVRRGVPADHLRVIYSACDLKLSTTSGEGWGLTTMEAMACGLPCIVPDFAALGEWAEGAAWCVPAPITLRHCGEFEGHGINHAGKVPEVGAVVHALETLYQDRNARDNLAARGLTLVDNPRYAWANITTAFDAVLREACAPATLVLEAEAVPA